KQPGTKRLTEHCASDRTVLSSTIFVPGCHKNHPRPYCIRTYVLVNRFGTGGAKHHNGWYAERREAHIWWSGEEAEGVSGRIEAHPDVLLRLDGRELRAARERPADGALEIVDEDIEVLGDV